MILICAAVMLCFSCGSDDGGSENTAATTADSGDIDNNIEEILPAEEIVTVTDDVPEYNFNGADFIVASVDNPNFSNIYVVDEEIGEILNDSIYKRTVYIEERFNVKMQEIFVGDGDVP